jgi:hypothetical protein
MLLVFVATISASLVLKLPRANIISFPIGETCTVNDLHNMIADEEIGDFEFYVANRGKLF